MVAKKRNTLRNKVSSKINSHSILENLQNDIDVQLPEDPKAFLHQPKETKREKQLNKQSAFISRVQEKSMGMDPSFAGISKSSIRRRKRKMRDNLKPRMDDLLVSLEREDDLRDITQNTGEHADDEETRKRNRANVTKVVSRNEPGSVLTRRNEPSIRNKKGAKTLQIKETERFNQVLKNQLFQTNTFGALREVIKMQKR
ncbi:hypothetical protein KAFR_0K01430 [Kazachstania africana CBS 2517]|uniref:Ribosome biogenesis protein SLX9 n=1 Tax=Kazachstania africana (strain ATCC 22294 / BCRC 22015 / CBS 2517 / CECT 1963 / NBRC 1671 / NRRL Y-8276) TaxID=1071382 RepID=H2B1J7_KAZAF|nr:hypothetical protein KAFR_0K01430 [Kazachstania africana CBS 2517]CCF60497.1 hypothetical protein KAFR_0K01430 [Kazachstania africana CBS 2517]